nr:MAG TPA: hypothetical protein [Caudoviricetes sp.]
MFPSVLLALSIQKTRKGIRRNIQRGYLSYGMEMVGGLCLTSRRVQRYLFGELLEQRYTETRTERLKYRLASMLQRFNSVEAKVMACHLQMFSLNGKIIVVGYHSN